MKVGLVLGKFMPPHRGHQQLIRFARRWVDRLYVVVESVKGEVIPCSQRYHWMQQLFPDCVVLLLTTHQPQEPSEHPAFWQIWKQTLRGFLPESIDFVFASEPYGTPLADILDARFIPVDIARQSVHISATRIRSQPHVYWDRIPSVVQHYFRKKISVFGPESTGKTTLTKKLAAHFSGSLVPEYARGYLEAQNGSIGYEDMYNIARGQSILEELTEQDAKPFLFCDTDPLATKIWSQFLYDRCDPKIIEIAQKHCYHCTLLLDVDVPWVADEVRYLPTKGKAFFAACRAELSTAKRQFIIIRGSWDERWQQAKKAVEELPLVLPEYR